MIFEEKIATVQGLDVFIRTDKDLRDKDYEHAFNIITNRIKNIFNQIELHDDYEDLLKSRERLNQIEQIINDSMAEYSNKKYKLAAEIDNDEDEFPF